MVHDNKVHPKIWFFWRHSKLGLSTGWGQFGPCTRCLKITEKVSFNIASEASYVYISSGQKFIKIAKIEKLKCDILDDFWTLCKLKFSEIKVKIAYRGTMRSSGLDLALHRATKAKIKIDFFILLSKPPDFNWLTPKNLKAFYTWSALRKTKIVALETNPPILLGLTPKPFRSFFSLGQ